LSTADLQPHGILSPPVDRDQSTVNIKDEAIDFYHQYSSDIVLFAEMAH